MQATFINNYLFILLAKLKKMEAFRFNYDSNKSNFQNFHDEDKSYAIIFPAFNHSTYSFSVKHLNLGENSKRTAMLELEYTTRESNLVKMTTLQI